MATSYQGPNVSVTQQFAVSPGAVAIESLPSVAVATAYDVYQQESLGNFFGLVADTVVPWGTSNTVIYNKNIAGLKTYEMYPPKMYANTRYGDINLEIDYEDFASEGITLNRDTMYAVPGTTKVAGSCQGIIPYYKADLAAQILSSDLQTVIIANGTVVTSQVTSGQRVFIYSGGNYINVGTVGSVGTDETKITLTTPYTGTISGTKILVGSANGTTLINYPEVLYDATADFVTAKVAPGDVLKLSTLSISGSISSPIYASITAIINKNTLRFNTSVLSQGQIDYSYTQYFPQYGNTPIGIGHTIQLYSYSVNRLVGFSKNYGLKLLDRITPTTTTTAHPAFPYDGVRITVTNQTQFSIPASELQAAGITLNKGDVFTIRAPADRVSETDNERDADTNKFIFPNTIDTIILDSDNYVITTINPTYRSNKTTATVSIATGDYIDAWSIVQETELLADFRAIRSEEHNVVHRVTSVKDIFTYWVRSEETSIDPRNELAFMMNVIFASSGGKVCYGINVDSSANNLSTEYSEALEELKLFDVYSHCFGTTDTGVNGLIGPYCDDQSAPYEAHERTGIICYDTDDLYLMGSDSINAILSGKITLSGALNLITAGVTINDIVNIFDSNGLPIASATVLETPTEINQVQTDYTGTYAAGSTVRIESGRKDDQAVRAGNIQYGNRRVTMGFPGWFYAEFDGTRMLLPPYFIAAAVSGMDSGIIASQSFTNYPFSISGLSNIELNTNTYFRKNMLDEIGGGGVDIMIQDATITQVIKSRHDLTTNMDAVEYRERSITKQADVCAKTLRTAVAPYVGRYNVNDANLFKFLGQICTVTCTKLMNSGVIFNIAVTSIKRDEVIADKVNFYVTATVYVAGNYYDITMLIKSR